MICGTRLSLIVLIGMIWAPGIISSNSLICITMALLAKSLWTIRRSGRIGPTVCSILLLRRCMNSHPGKHSKSHCLHCLIEDLFSGLQNCILSGKFSPCRISISILGGGRKSKKSLSILGETKMNTVADFRAGLAKDASCPKFEISPNFKEF